MLRHPVQLTSLEEDFKKLGLLSEQEESGYTQTGAGSPAPQMKPAPSGAPAPNKNGSRNVGAQSEGDSDEGKDGNDTVPGHEGAVPPKASLPTTPGAQKESITGGDSRRQRLRGEASDKDDEKEDEKDDDEDEKDDEKDDDKEESVELVGTNQVAEAIGRLRGGQKTESRQGQGEKGRKKVTESKEGGPLSKVSALIEDVNSIMESIDDSRRSDAVRAFANSSIISEMLARGFAGFAEQYEDEDLAAAAEAFATLSEDAANVAHALEEGEEIEADALQGEFRAQMDALMDGLDLYSDVVEGDAELEEEEEQEEETEATGEEQTEEEEQEEETEQTDPPARATGGIVSQRTESYFKHGKMGPSGKKGGMKEKKYG